MALYINRIELTNYRCYRDLVLEPGRHGADPAWTVLLGNNATGKTSLLRCIAMGMCDESSTAALLKESDEGVIRRWEPSAAISIQFVDTSKLKRRYSIRTVVTAFEDGRAKFERVRQTTYPRTNFPWNDLFVCAYGAGRGTSGSGDVVGYSPLNATYNLFNYGEGLQNPELTLWRIEKKVTREASLRVLERILPDISDGAISLDERGITVTSRLWGKGMPFKDLADGFKSSMLWVTDFIGWAISRNPNIQRIEDISGIVLIDEIEQHLHPSWRQTIVDNLRQAFPKIQFIATTHSQSVARSLGGPDFAGAQANDVLFRLMRDEENECVVGDAIPHITALNADQALLSDAFRLPSSTIENVNKWVGIYRELHEKDTRSVQEEITYNSLRDYLLSHQFQPGGDEIDRGIKSNLKKYLSKYYEEFGDTE